MLWASAHVAWADTWGQFVWGQGRWGTGTTKPMVLYPSAAGITLARGQPVTLQWGGFSGTTVRIQLVKGGTVQATDIASSAPNTGSFVWTISSAQQANTNYQIKITAGGVSDVSNNMFAIAP